MLFLACFVYGNFEKITMMKKIKYLLFITVFASCEKNIDLPKSVLPQGNLNKVLYSDCSVPFPDLYTMNADGSDNIRLTNFSNSCDFCSVTFGSWRQDGGKVVFCGTVLENNAYKTEIFTINPDGSELQRITFNTLHESNPLFSPFGDKIYYTAATGDNSVTPYQIFTVNHDGTEDEQLTFFSNGNDSCASFITTISPTGDKILFSSNKDASISSMWDLYSMDLQGNDIIRITYNSEDFGSLTFSPDGNKLAFIREVNQNPQIFTINADFTGLSQITNFNSPNLNGIQLHLNSVSWAPDGTKIIFSSNLNDLNDYGEFYTINADGTDLTQITNNGLCKTNPRWR